MPRSCSVCSHPEAYALNESLVIEKASNRSIAKQYGVDHNAVQRHRAHIPKLLLEASKHTEEFETDRILMRVELLEKATLEQLQKARNEVETIADRRVVLDAIREQRENLKLVARIREIIDDAPQINVLLSAEWIEVRTAVIEALEPYPEAKMSVVNALGTIEEAAS